MNDELLRIIDDLQKRIEALETGEVLGLDWDNTWSDAVHSHANAGEGGQLDWDNIWFDAIHDHSAAAEGGQNLHSIQELEFNDSTELTISGGAVTRTQVYHSIDTEGDAATDDLDTVNGGAEADLLVFRQNNSARDIKVTEAGNIIIPSGPDMWLDTTGDAGGYLYDGTLSKWLQFANPFGRWALIAETILGADAGSVTFATIPQTFRHLILAMTLRTDRASELDSPVIQFNGDTAGNYDMEYITAIDTTVTSDGVRANTNIWCGICEGGNATASAFTGILVYIPNYTDTNFFKTASIPPVAAFGNVSADTDCALRTVYGKWRSANAITSITVDQGVGPNFVQYCKFALYGVL
jgi:hypothetical protein